MSALSQTKSQKSEECLMQLITRQIVTLFMSFYSPLQLFHRIDSELTRAILQQGIMKGFLLTILILLTLTSALVFSPHSHVRPHPDKVAKGGEDAHYESNRLMVVADGVGGCADLGIDPRFYSRKLCTNSERFYNQNPDYYTHFPDELIVDAHRQNHEDGSSTMSVATIHGSTLRTCHVGDSHLYVFRKFDENFIVIYESMNQVHGFNFPMQLARDDTDDPRNAVCASLSVKKGDVVVMSSDGLADNLFTFEIARQVTQHVKEGTVSQLAQRLTAHAAHRAQQEIADTPFLRKAKEYGEDFKGGKPDDTTVIVSEVLDE